MKEALFLMFFLFFAIIGAYLIVLFLYKDILKEIKFSIKPLFIKMDINTSLILELVFSVWQMNKSINKIKMQNPNINTRAIDSAYNKIKNIFTKMGFETIDYTNKRFNEGLNIEIIATNKVSEKIEPYVKETIEPTILYKGNILKKAKVIKEITEGV